MTSSLCDIRQHLYGEQVQLFPYARGVYGRDTLGMLWHLVDESGTSAALFYAQECPDERWRGDLTEFVTFFAAPMRQLVIVARHDGTPIGLVWFERVAGEAYGLFGLWYQRHTTRLAREGTTLAQRYARDVLGYPRLRGFTPWRTAVQHVLAVGWHRVATLPDFVTIQGRPRPLYVLEWKG